MKKFLLLLLLASGLFAQTPLYLFDSPIKGNAVSQNGSNQYEYVTPALRMTGTYSLRDDFSDGNYNGWIVASGAYSVDTLTNPLSSNRYNLKCTTAGVISIPMNQAYGRWKFQVYKGADDNSSYYYFLHGSTDYTANNGYRFYIDQNEQIGVGIRTVATYMYTANSYVANNVWYEIEIERNTNGQTYTYITGGAYTQKTLVSVSGGSGSNPFTNNTYTSSNYFVLDLDANDRISNISCEYGEGSLDLNSFERVLHSDDRDFATLRNWAVLGSATKNKIGRSSVDKHSGTYSMVDTTDGAGDANNCIQLPASASVPLVANEKCTIEGWVRGTGILGSNLFLNASFETAGAGGADVFANWTEEKGGTSAISQDVDAQSGSYACKFVIDGSGSYVGVRQNILTIGKTYKVTFWAKYSGTVGGISVYNNSGTSYYSTGNLTTTYTLYTTYFMASQDGWIGFLRQASISTNATLFVDNISIQEVTLPSLTLSIGGQSKTVANISCVPGTFTKVVWNLQATSVEVGQPIKLWANQADVIYWDDFSVTQRKDWIANIWVSSSNTTSQGAILDLASGDNFGAIGITLSKRHGVPYNGLYARIVSNTGAGAQTGEDIQIVPTNDITSTLWDGRWHLITLIAEFGSNISIHMDGSLIAGTSNPLAGVGKLSNLTPLSLGALSTGAVFFAGLIGETQITKFKDIAQSNVNANTLLSAYRQGLPKTWIGGGALEVFNPQYRGATLTEAGKDKSTVGNDLTFVNQLITDLIYGQGYYIKP